MASRIATGRRAGRPVIRVGDCTDPDVVPELDGERCASARGVSLHANVAVPARDRRRLERLCRYVARPPLATERLSRLADGRLLYRLKHRWRDGTTHVVFEPDELVEKLAALVPPRRFHLVRYHGVLGPCASQRSRVVPGREPPGGGATDAPEGMSLATPGHEDEERVSHRSGPADVGVLGPRPGSEVMSSREPLPEADVVGRGLGQAGRALLNRRFRSPRFRSPSPRSAPGASPGPICSGGSSRSTCSSALAAARARGSLRRSTRPTRRVPSSPASASRRAPHRSRPRAGTRKRPIPGRPASRARIPDRARAHPQQQIDPTPIRSGAPSERCPESRGPSVQASPRSPLRRAGLNPPRRDIPEGKLTLRALPDVESPCSSSYALNARLVGAGTGGAIRVEGAELPQSVVLLGLGWSVEVAPQLQILADYDALLGSDRTEHQASVALRLRF